MSEQKKATPQKKQSKNPAARGTASSASAYSAQKKQTNGDERSESLSRGAMYLIVFLAFYIILTLLVAGLVYYSFNEDTDSVDLYSVKVVYDEKTLYSLPASSVNNEYGLYVPFSYLTEICSFGLAGDGDNVTVFIIGTDSRIECTKNSSLIIINDNPIRISAPILYENSEYLIPVVLLDNYINGIDVTYDNEEMLCTLSSSLGKTDVSLKLQLPEEMEAAYFPDSYKEYIFEESNPEGTQP